MLRCAKHPDQFQVGVFEPGIVGAVGQRHLSPVHDALNPDAVFAGMHQVLGKVGVVDAINADLYGAKPVWLLSFRTNDLVDMIVDKALWMKRMVLLPLGEFGGQVQRMKVMVVPVGVGLQFPTIQFVGSVVIAGGPLR